MKDLSVSYHDDIETGVRYYTVVSANTLRGTVFLKVLQEAMRGGGPVGRITYDGVESRKQLTDHPNVYQAINFDTSAKDVGITIEQLGPLED